MSAPVSLGGLFGPNSSSDDEGGGNGFANEAEESTVVLAGLPVRVRQRPFHPLNANAVWPGTLVLAEWIAANAAERLAGRRILELGAATGALAVFCVRAHGLDVTTSDVDDGEVEEAVAENFTLNGLPPPPHLPHTWGTPLPAHVLAAPFDVVIASDILLYVRAYPALVDTLEALCAPRDGHPVRHRSTTSALRHRRRVLTRGCCCCGAGRGVLHVLAAAAEGERGVLRAGARARLCNRPPGPPHLRDPLRGRAAAGAGLSAERAEEQDTRRREQGRVQAWCAALPPSSASASASASS